VCGLLPWELALTVVLIPSTIAALGLHGSERISDLLHPGGAVWVLIAAPLTVAFVPLAATLYHWRRRHWWHGPQRSSWLLAMAASAGMLVLLVLLDAAFMRAVPYLIGGGLVTWLTLLALLGDAREELLARRTLGPALRELAWHQDLPDALEQVAVLQHEDPDGVYVLTGRRFRSLTWFFGPYVPLRILGTPSTHSQS
jgi:O-antigen/teichoic acid export membrane protein